MVQVSIILVKKAGRTLRPSSLLYQYPVPFGSDDIGGFFLLVFPQFPLVLIIGISGKSGQYYDFTVGKRPAEVLGMLANDLLGGNAFLGGQLGPLLLSDLLAVQAGCFDAFTGPLVEVLNLFFALLKSKANAAGRFVIFQSCLQLLLTCCHG